MSENAMNCSLDISCNIMSRKRIYKEKIVKLFLSVLDAI
jgi:hypothetical protein